MGSHGCVLIYTRLNAPGASPPGGLLYLCVLIVMVILGAIAIWVHEAHHPLHAGTDQVTQEEGGASEPTISHQPEMAVAPAEFGAPEQGRCASLNGATVSASALPEDSGGLHTSSLGTPLVGAPATARRGRFVCAGGAMALVYAGSLGLDEAMSDLCIKAWSGILARCNDDGTSCFQAWVLYTIASIWVVGSFASVMWYRWVLARYETMVALPIEYGAEAHTPPMQIPVRSPNPCGTPAH